MKTYILIISLMIIAATTHGQTIFLKFGPSYSKLTFKSPIIEGPEKTSDEPGIIGFDVLAGVNYLNFKYFYLSSSVGYIQKGGIISYNYFSLDPAYFHDTPIMNFLTISTSFSPKITIKKFIEPYLSLGPRLDYLFSYKETGQLLKGFDQKTNYHNKVLNKLIYGILFGGGINFRVKGFILGLNFDYYFNLNKLVDYYNNRLAVLYNQYSNEQLYDQTFTVNALIGFKF